MTKKNLKEFAADHEGGDVVQGGEVMDPTDAEGGPIAKRLADLMAQVDPEAEEVEDITPGNTYVREDLDLAESFTALFEGMDLTEEFKSKVSTIFEAAVNESVSSKMATLTEELSTKLAEQLEEELETSVNESMDALIEQVDSYLDYVVNEWMTENEVAIEAGIKVEMAESFMSGLKNLFEEHNVEVNEETVDVVSALEEELAASRNKANEIINENIRLNSQLKNVKAEKVFESLTEGLTLTQVERFKVLSEKLSRDDLEEYATDLSLIKESFFKSKKPVLTEKTEEITLTEEKVTPRSQSDLVNLYATALNNLK